MQSRIKFMLDILMAVRNNNMRKIPNCDNSHIEHLKKIIKNFIRGIYLSLIFINYHSLCSSPKFVQSKCNISIIIK